MMDGTEDNEALPAPSDGDLSIPDKAIQKQAPWNGEDQGAENWNSTTISNMPTVSPRSLTQLSGASFLKLPKFSFSVPMIFSPRSSQEIPRLQTRPSTMPSKSKKEEERHVKEYLTMVETFAARMQFNVDKDREQERKHLESQRRRESQAASGTAEWKKIIPDWNLRYNSAVVRRLWSHGLPPKVRGTVWELAVGNQAAITPEMYASIVSQIRPFVDADFSETGSEAEPEAGSPQFWARTINVDLPRTYPVLAFFHKGGPLCGPLHEVLLAYAVFRPEIGYVQGMSYIVAMLLLNIEETYSAFKSLANMIAKHPHMSTFLAMDMDKINEYCHEFDIHLQKKLPKLHKHFFALGVSLDMVLLDW